MERDVVEVKECGATSEMVVFCFDTLLAALYGKPLPVCPSTISNDKFPLFVTWKKGSHSRLRGCIGTFAHLKLHAGLRDYALTSAFRDSRFNPIILAELPDLSCSVSLLINFEPAKNYLDWTVGVHGIRIHYFDGVAQRDAVYLPEVAAEQGWNHRETIDNLIEKGGYNGFIDERFRMNVKVVRFQSSKVTLTYHEFLSMKSIKQRNLNR
ncbi:unnamed protein product [Auanema sp. JU1783]|nr:unnamed protein product [Auanema sp. JU1783]